MRVLLTFFAILFLGGPAWGASAGAPAYRSVRGEAGYPWFDGLIVNFDSDQMQCRKHYGRQWREKCAVSLGRPGRDENRVKMNPEAAGHWQWRDATSLIFMPDSPRSLAPDTVYKIDVSQIGGVSWLKLDKQNIIIHTPPLAAQLTGSSFWIDPSEKARHRLAFSFQFNYPPPESAFSPRLDIPEGMSVEAPEIVWNQNRDTLNISWPVIKLADMPCQARILLDGFGEIDAGNGKYRYVAPAGREGGAIFQQNCPGARDLFFVKSANLEEGYDENLDRRHTLTLETSLYARGEDINANLEVWELPTYRSAEATCPYDWQNTPSITGDDLKRGRRISAVLLNAGSTPRSRFSFAVDAADGSYIIARLKPGFQSASGQIPQRPWQSILRVPTPGARIEFMQGGNLLSGDGIIDIYASDIDRIDWVVTSAREPFLALLAQGSSDVFSRPLEQVSIPMEAVGESASGSLHLEEKKQGDARFAHINLRRQLERISGKDAGLAMVTLRGHRNGQPVAYAEKLHLVTNLGLIVKKSANMALDCFASFLDDGQPAAGARLSVLGINGLPVFETVTDESGHAAIPPLAGLKRESRPVAVMASLNSDLAWLPMEDKTRELNLSSFSTAGVRGQSSTGLNVFVFGQRGVYRPGETVYFGCMAKGSDFSALRDGAPLYAEILDPRGVRVWEETLKTGECGLAELKWAAPASANAGKYILNIRPAKNGPVLSSASCRIEEFVPETLKLRIAPPAMRGWRKSGSAPVKMSLQLQNLYGTPAAANKIKARVETAPAVFAFKGYEDYSFTDPMPFAGSGNARELGAVFTDNDGRAEITVPADLVAASSSLISVSGEGFEKAGGRAATARESFLVSPVNRIMGYRPINALTNLDFIPAGSEAELEFIALDQDLRRVKWEDVKFSILNREYVTSLVSDGAGGFHYDETPTSSPVRQWRETIPVAGRKISLPTERPGEFLLVAQGDDGRTLARISFAVTGNMPRMPDSPLAGSKMRMKLDKYTYQPGEKINISMALPYAGHGLITIESDGVKAFRRFSAPAGSAVQSIAIPDDFEGKGYLGVMFGRSLQSPNIYMEPLAYALAPFSANSAKRDMGLRITGAMQAQPGQSLAIEVSSQKPGKAFVFAVDEGVLLLDNFQTPDPLTAILEDRGLDVSTIQALDLLMPTHARLAPRLSAFGGGMEGAPFGARFQNPFKRRGEPPLALWLGPVDVGPAPARLSLPIPGYYLGSMRIMAVGSSSDGAGSISRGAAVSAPVMLKPQFPLAVAPGDEFEASVVIECDSAEPAEIGLKIDIGEGVEALRSVPDRIAVEKSIAIPIRLRALDRPGAASVNFSAERKGKKYVRSANFSIRPATPFRTTASAGKAEANSTIGVKRDLYPFGAKTEMAVSATPLPLLAAFGGYLDNYPHGCAEQLLSRSLAHVIIGRVTGKKANSPEFQKLLDSVLGVLRAQGSPAGLSLWPGSTPDLLLTAYAVDFLLELRQAGLGSHDDLLNMFCAALEYGCALNESSLSAARACAYAIWALTREGRVTTQLLENLKSSLQERGVAGWQTDLTGALMAASQREMKMSQTFPVENIEYSADGWFDDFAQYALHMAILARYFPELCTAERKNDFYDVTVNTLNAGSYATFSACQGMRALAWLSDAQKSDDILAVCKKNGGSGVCAEFAIDAPETLFPLYWQLTESGYDCEMAAREDKKGIVVERSFLDIRGEPLEQIRQGDVVTVVVRARSTVGDLKDCVITDLLPGGFEMIFPKKDEEMPDKVRFKDRREDRMLLFTDLGNDPLVFSWQVRAVTPGQFSAPPVSVECMYDAEHYGSGEPGIIEIKK